MKKVLTVKYSEDTMRYKEYLLPVLSDPALPIGFLFVLLKREARGFLAACSLAAFVQHLAISRLC